MALRMPRCSIEAESAESSGLLAQSSGFVTHGPGISATNDGVIGLVMAVVFGGFCGMMGGFIVAHLCRYLTYVTGRNLGRGRWVLIGALLGAVAFGIKACVDGRE